MKVQKEKSPDSRRAWYRHWFSLDYLALYSHRDEKEAAQAVDLIETHIPVDNDSKILDLCCGDGRHSVEFAGRGYNVIGLDLSSVLLAAGNNRISENKFVDANIALIRGDMRILPFSCCFDLVVNLFTSWGYFEDAENLDVIRAVAEILKDGGHLFLDYLNKPYIFNNLKYKTTSRIDQKTVTEIRNIVDSGTRIEKRIIIESDGDVEDYLESVRIYSEVELVEMFTQVGFRITNMFGDYAGNKLYEDSPRAILVATKE